MDFKKKVIIDILESRQSRYISDYLFSIGKKECSNVKYIVIDMFKAYRNLAKMYFPNATLLVDPFHVIKYLNDTVNKARKKGYE